MANRKILILHSSSDLYGASRILLFTVSLLKAEGHEIFVALSDKGPLNDELKALGVRVFEVRLGILRRKYFTVKGVFNRVNVMRRALKDLKEICLNNAIDLIYSNTTGVLVGALLARKTKTTHIWHVHEIIENPRWLKRFLGFVLRRYADKIVVVSQAVKAAWASCIPEHLFAVIHNGIDHLPFVDVKSTLREEINANLDDVVIGMIGRVHPWKGQDYFLKIAAKIHSKHPNVRFVMVGDAFPGNEYLYEKLERIKIDLGLISCVTDLGFRTDIPNIMCGLDVFILPSILPDPFPTVILEAMAATKPVVATSHGGASEMVLDGQTGVLIPWDDEEAAYSRVKNVIENASLRKQMGDSAKERLLEKFTLASFKKRFITSVNSL